MKSKFIHGQFYIENFNAENYDIISQRMIDVANQHRVALETGLQNDGKFLIEYYIKKNTLTMCKAVLNEIKSVARGYKINFVSEFRGETI